MYSVVLSVYIMLLISPLLKPYVSLIFKIHSAELVQSQLSQWGHREVTGFSKTPGCQAWLCAVLWQAHSQSYSGLHVSEKAVRHTKLFLQLTQSRQLLYQSPLPDWIISSSPLLEPYVSLTVEQSNRIESFWKHALKIIYNDFTSGK